MRVLIECVMVADKSAKISGLGVGLNRSSAAKVKKPRENQ